MREGPVRRFIRRLNHRDKVLEHLGAFLLLYPPGRQFAKDFPDLRATIRAHFEAGIAPASSATQIAAAILARLLRQLRQDERAAVLARLLATDVAVLGEIAAATVARRRAQASGRVTFSMQLTGVAVFMARRMTETGVLRDEDYDHLLTAIDEALRADTLDPDAAADARPLQTAFGLQQPSD